LWPRFFGHPVELATSSSSIIIQHCNQSTVYSTIRRYAQ